MPKYVYRNHTGRPKSPPPPPSFFVCLGKLWDRYGTNGLCAELGVSRSTLYSIWEQKRHPHPKLVASVLTSEFVL